MASDETRESPEITEGEPNEETPTGDMQETPTESEAERWKKQALGQKSYLEDANRQLAEMKAQIQALQGQSGQSPAATGSAVQDQAQDLVEKARALAAQGDAAAALALEERAARLQLEANTAHLWEISQIEDKGLREKVQQHFRSNRHRLADVQAAKNEVLAEQQQAKIAELQDQLTKLSNGRPKQDVVRTVHREATDAAPDFKQSTMTGAEFDTQIAKLNAAGKWKEAMKLEAELNRGKITLKE